MHPLEEERGASEEPKRVCDAGEEVVRRRISGKRPVPCESAEVRTAVTGASKHGTGRVTARRHWEDDSGDTATAISGGSQEMIAEWKRRRLRSKTTARTS